VERKRVGVRRVLLAASAAQGAIGTDEHGYRAEFLGLVKKAKSLKR
jgi:hypothetical protein